MNSLQGRREFVCSMPGLARLWPGYGQVIAGGRRRKQAGGRRRKQAC